MLQQYTNSREERDSRENYQQLFRNRLQLWCRNCYNTLQIEGVPRYRRHYPHRHECITIFLLKRDRLQAISDYSESSQRCWGFSANLVPEYRYRRHRLTPRRKQKNPRQRALVSRFSCKCCDIHHDFAENRQAASADLVCNSDHRSTPERTSQPHLKTGKQNPRSFAAAWTSAWERRERWQQRWGCSLIPIPNKPRVLG